MTACASRTTAPATTAPATQVAEPSATTAAQPTPTEATTSTAAPTVAPTEAPAAAPTGAMLSPKQVSFNDQRLTNEAVRVQTRPASPVGSPNAPGPGVGEPESLRFTFREDKVDEFVSPLQRQLVFYPVAAYQDLLNSEYVAFFYPVKTSALPDKASVTAKEASALAKNYETYVRETTEKLNRLPSKEFTPDLAKLDALIESLTIERQ